MKIQSHLLMDGANSLARGHFCSNLDHPIVKGYFVSLFVRRLSVTLVNTFHTVR